jgi:lipoate---protein ligase
MASFVKTGTAVRKIAGGKLIRVIASCSGRLDQVKVLGDFFLFPEEVIFKIEEALSGASLPLEPAALVQKIEAVLTQNEAEMIGVGPEDIVSTLEEAVSACSD